MDLKKLKYIVAGIAVILLGIIIFQNFEQKTIRILFAEIRMPISILLILTFVIGLIAGWVANVLISKKTKNTSNLE